MIYFMVLNSFFALHYTTLLLHCSIPHYTSSHTLTLHHTTLLHTTGFQGSSEDGIQAPGHYTGISCTGTEAPRCRPSCFRYSWHSSKRSRYVRTHAYTLIRLRIQTYTRTLHKTHTHKHTHTHTHMYTQAHTPTHAHTHTLVHACI